jgi:uncharacterized protein (TIGR02145 family)
MFKLKIVIAFKCLLLVVLSSCHSSNSSSKYSENAVEMDSTCIKDVDGNVYKTIKIGNQVWMQENLRVTHFRNGDPIPNLSDSAAWVDTEQAAFCNYNNDTGYVRVYGRLYNWYAASDARNICPVGWRVPHDSDYRTLDYHYGGATVSGAALKEQGLLHWKEPNAGATNESKFSALPGGHRGETAIFERMGYYAFFWNVNKYQQYNDTNYAHECSLNYSLSYFNQDWGCKNRGMSIRCIKE